jgi:hypothetical protein
MCLARALHYLFDIEVIYMDYRNSIKESIFQLLSMWLEITKASTLGKGLKKFKKRVIIPQTL